MRKKKKNSWHELQEEKCPKCKNTLMNGLFSDDYSGCSCGFNIDTSTKELIVKRDKNE